jgi:hypothetical protein
MYWHSGGSLDVVRFVDRLTARISVALFSLSFVAAALAGNLTRWIINHRRNVTRFCWGLCPRGSNEFNRSKHTLNPEVLTMKTISIVGAVLAGALLSLPALSSEVHATIDGVKNSKAYPLRNLSIRRGVSPRSRSEHSSW